MAGVYGLPAHLQSLLEARKLPTTVLTPPVISTDTSVQIYVVGEPIYTLGVVYSQDKMPKKTLLGLMNTKVRDCNKVLVVVQAMSPAAVQSLLPNMEFIPDRIVQLFHRMFAYWPAFEVLNESQILQWEQLLHIPRNRWPIIGNQDPFVIYLGLVGGMVIRCSDSLRIVT